MKILRVAKFRARGQKMGDEGIALALPQRVIDATRDLEPLRRIVTLLSPRYGSRWRQQATSPR